MKTPRAALARSVGQAIDDNTALGSLLAGHRRAQACFARAAPVLSAGLRADTRAGPIDGTSWTLFAAHGAAAAKLRQALPSLLAAVQAYDRSIAEIRIKVRPREPG